MSSAIWVIRLPLSCHPSAAISNQGVKPLRASTVQCRPNATRPRIANGRTASRSSSSRPKMTARTRKGMARTNQTKSSNIESGAQSSASEPNLRRHGTHRRVTRQVLPCGSRTFMGTTLPKRDRLDTCGVRRAVPMGSDGHRARHPVVVREELVAGLDPAPSHGQLTAPLAEEPALPIGDDAGDRTTQASRCCWVVEESRLQVAHRIDCPAGAWCHDGYAAGRRLAQGVGAGLLLAGVDQHVEGGHRRGQVTRLDLAEKLGVSQALLEPTALWAVADDHEPHAGHRGDLDQTTYAVALVQASDESDDDERCALLVPARPRGVQEVVAQVWVPGGHVHAGAPHGSLDAERVESLLHPVAGDHDRVRAGVPLAQPDRQSVVEGKSVSIRVALGG